MEKKKPGGKYTGRIKTHNLQQEGRDKHPIANPRTKKNKKKKKKKKKKETIFQG